VRLANILAAKNYEFVGRLGADLVFKRRDVRRLPQTTVICAVWHGDPDRHRLLQGHAANLARQTAPADIVYVFDNGDAPPPGLPGSAIVVKDPLTIYQAWNVALSLVKTRYVMNLNLDDRIAPDAIAKLEHTMAGEHAAVVGGEWKICYSQQETDAVDNCFPAEQLPFSPSWPPPPGTTTCLGSGTGRRQTLGPAVMWAIDVHRQLPRFPWRCTDGSLIETLGDAIFWAMLEQRMKKKLVRLPIVIGNYHSHPSEQAEFRHRQQDELALINSAEISTI
jgi:hypothetical protein